MPTSHLLDRLQHGVLIGDGLIGTALPGLTPGACAELWNIDHPDAVVAAHTAFIEAGAEYLYTNTFGANRLILERHRAADRVRTLNRAAVALARAAAGDAYVIGDIGPCGGILDPLGDVQVSQAYDAFREQADALLEGGVDGLVVQTMFAVEEVAIAVQAARDAGARCVIASMAFDSTRVGPRTMMGVTPEQAAAAMFDAGAHVIGTNCGTEMAMADYTGVVREMRSAVANIPICARPNAGKPTDSLVYPRTPEEFAAGSAALAAAGAVMLGGCCGMTPAHIAALRAAMRAIAD